MAVNGVIQKLFLEVDSNDVTINHHRADEVMQLVKTEVLPQLEEILERLFEQTNLRLQIDRLDLDLGSCNQQNLAQVLGEQLREQLPVAIKDKLNTLDVEPSRQSESQAQYGEQLHQDRSGNATSKHVPSSEGRLVDITIYFLQTGHLPWWSSADESLSTIKECWEMEIEAGTALSKIERLLQVAAAHPKMRKRLLLQFKLPFVVKALSISEKHHHKVAFLEAVMQTHQLHLQSKSESASNKVTQFKLPTRLEKIWFESALEEALKTEARTAVNVLDWLAGIVVKINPRSAGQITEIKKVLRLANTSAIPQLLKAIEEDIPQVWDALKLPSEEIAERKVKSRNGEPKTLLAKDTFADEVLENVFSPKRRENDESIYILNAGLVLLHPFLPHFFKSLELTENHRFADEEARLRAIYILHYVATGQVTTTEDQLYFEKFICAWPEDEPLPDYTIQNKADLDHEIERLWAAVQSRWAPMKASHFNALRVNFLMRPGKLEQDHAGHWTLTVEPDGRDVLLQMIDWSVYLLRLPWMAEVVYVDWGK